MFRKMPFVLLAIIVALIFLDPFIPDMFKQILYATSLTLKSVILFFLPFIVFGLLFKAVVSLASQATKVLLLVFCAVVGSNFVSTFLSHYVGSWVYNFDLSLIALQAQDALPAAWSLELPRLIANDKAMFCGIITALILSTFKPQSAERLGVLLDRIVTKIFSVFVYLIPLFVAGFVTKMQADGVIHLCIKEYTVIFALVACAQFGYLLIVYFLLSNGRFAEWISSLKNMLPAAISGFSTMSSAASMPLTMIGAENNTKNKDIARSVIATTVNIHLVGDCFAIPIFAYAVLKNFGFAEPLLSDYLIFACFFVLAKFSVAAVPGGGILVMLPILESYLGFTAEMMSLITALYILFDPVITCANVLGNGAFARMIDRCIGLLKLQTLSKNLSKCPQDS